MPRNQPSGYINVDELLPQITVEQAAAYYGVALPDLHRIGAEIRTRCFLHCGYAEQTGDRALAIQAEHPARQWHCHQYGCGKGGNLVSLCDLMKPGPSAGGRPRGERFKEIAADLKAMAEGVLSSPGPKATTPPRTEPETPKVNIPLARSDNERARGLTELDRKFVTEPSAMPAIASAYFRRRRYLTPETCQKWRMGYLPRDGGEDKSGGTMRGSIVYPILSEAGDVLTWFGRDPAFEEKHRQWTSGGKHGREPEKFHFVKGFHRGLELFGQHASRLEEEGFQGRLRDFGLTVVEGPNDVIALDALGVPAVGLCSNHITDEQVKKLSRFARQVAGNRVVVMLDCDDEGEQGAQHALGLLAAHCNVRLAWTSAGHKGRFKRRQPESLSPEEWAVIAETLR